MNDMQHVSCVVLRTKVDVKLVCMTNHHTTKEDLESQVKKFFWLHFLSHLHNDKSFVIFKLQSISRWFTGRFVSS